MDCMKAEWKGRCCCTCRHQRVIVKHPWNDGTGKGRITETMGYGCEPPDLAQEECKRVVFFDCGHGLCEMHDFVRIMPQPTYTTSTSSIDT
jgi:hypothetical protein